MNTQKPLAGYEIRELRVEDLRQVLHLLAHLTKAPPLSDAELVRVFERRKAFGVVTKVAVDINTGRIIGTASLVVEPKFFRGGRNVGHIEDVVTHPDHRARGVGHQLLHALERCAEENNCYKIILDCCDDCAPFYEKKGFRQCERQMRLDLPMPKL
eukprot:gene4633-3337_t